MLYSLDQNGRATWVTCVRKLLSKYGYQHVWDAQGVENFSVFLREFSDTVADTYVTEWEQTLAESSKLVLFRQLKLGFVREDYLYNVTLKKYRASLAKLRCSAHELRIEKGRYKGELMADRVCKLCLKLRQEYVLEDEYHLFCCPCYLSVKREYLPQLVECQITYQLFIETLSNQNEDVQVNVACFVYQANKQRSRLLKELEI